MKIKESTFKALRFLALCLLVMYLVFGYRYRVTYNSGESMRPTFKNGEWIYIQKRGNLPSRWTPAKFDVIIVKWGGDNLTKRVIGVAGDTIEIKEGVIYLNEKKLPAHYQGKTRKVFEFIDKYKEENNDYKPSPAEIAKALKMTLLTVENIVFTREGVVSLDKKIGENEDQEIGDLIPDTSFVRPDEALANQDKYDKLHDLMEERLTPRERDILKLRFGFGVRDRSTLEKIGAKHNVTRERIRQIEMKAFRKLRFTLEKRKKDFQKLVNPKEV